MWHYLTQFNDGHFPSIFIHDPLTFHNLRWCPLTLHNLHWFHRLSTTYVDSTDSPQHTLMSTDSPQLTLIPDSPQLTLIPHSPQHTLIPHSPQLMLIPLTLHNLRWFHIPEFPHQAAQFCRRLAWTVELTLASSVLGVEGQGAPWRVGAAAVGVEGCLTLWGAGLTTGRWKWQLLLFYCVCLSFSYDCLCCWKWHCQTVNAVFVLMLKWKQKL